MIFRLLSLFKLEEIWAWTRLGAENTERNKWKRLQRLNFSIVYEVDLWGKMNHLILGWLSMNCSCYINVKMISRQLKMCDVFF